MPNSARPIIIGCFLPTKSARNPTAIMEKINAVNSTAIPISTTELKFARNNAKRYKAICNLKNKPRDCVVDKG